MAYELIVFDWDGTLMDSEARIVSCIQGAAADIGLDAPSESAAREIIGLGLREALARLFPAESGDIHDRLVNRYREHFLVLNQFQSKLFPGVREMLRALREAEFLLGVATGKSRHGLDRELTQTGLSPLFQATRCADETFSKPHPRMLQELMDELGVSPVETLVVGDTEYDMKMATNAGAQALGVSYGVHDSGRLSEHGALAVLDTLNHLTDWLLAASQDSTGKTT